MLNIFIIISIIFALVLSNILLNRAYSVMNNEYLTKSTKRLISSEYYMEAAVLLLVVFIVSVVKIVNLVL